MTLFVLLLLITLLCATVRYGKENRQPNAYAYARQGAYESQGERDEVHKRTKHVAPADTPREGIIGASI